MKQNKLEVECLWKDYYDTSGKRKYKFQVSLISDIRLRGDLKFSPNSLL